MQPSVIDLGNGSYRRRLRSMTSSRTTRLAALLAGDKPLTNHVLIEAGLPAPLGMTARDEDDAVGIAEALGYPVVIKPNRGHRGNGVFTDLQNETMLRQAWAKAREIVRDRQLRVEQHIAGNVHRIVVIDGEIQAAGRKENPTLTGDGVHTIQELIDIENDQPYRFPSPTPLTVSLSAVASPTDLFDFESSVAIVLLVCWELSPSAATTGTRAGAPAG